MTTKNTKAAHAPVTFDSVTAYGGAGMMPTTENFQVQALVTGTGAKEVEQVRRLIAAAPDLLAALIALTDAIADKDPLWHPEVLNAADWAILRATGGK